MGVEFTNTYGDIDENFYYGMENMYEKVIDLCNEDDEYIIAFADRLEDVVDNTDGIGWGVHDQLGYVFSMLRSVDED
ncbi:hypothetical protein [Bacillus sp. FSL K6-3431]|uniref:hypothetical protein n=1 Tax=Bacillus sp. FSL K6-3431 TaxID=2921500 RepID=UPI0030F590D5